MRRPMMAVVVAALILAVATAGGFAIAACGGSSGGTTTQAAASAAPGGRAPDMSALFTQALDPLVEAGTITSAQETAVVDALGSAGPGASGQGGQPPSSGSQPTPGATPTGTPPTGAPPSGTQAGPGGMFSSALGDLVDAGTITAAQKTAIADALSSAMPQGGPGQSGGTQAQTTQTF